MRLVLIFVVTFYCLYHHVSGNQQGQDPSKPFWPTRGRRSGGRLSIKADDDIPDKWADDDTIPIPVPEALSAKELRLPQRESAMSLLQSLLNVLSAWDGEIIRKRGDPKSQDPNNPFYAGRG